jgi:hypothetical protein
LLLGKCFPFAAFVFYHVSFALSSLIFDDLISFAPDIYLGLFMPFLAASFATTLV